MKWDWSVCADYIKVLYALLFSVYLSFSITKRFKKECEVTAIKFLQLFPLRPAPHLQHSERTQSNGLPQFSNSSLIELSRYIYNKILLILMEIKESRLNSSFRQPNMTLIN